MVTWPQAGIRAGEGQSKWVKRLSLTSGICPRPGSINVLLQHPPPWLLSPQHHLWSPAASILPLHRRCTRAVPQHFCPCTCLHVSQPRIPTATSGQAGIWQHPVTSFPSTGLDRLAQNCLGNCCIEEPAYQSPFQLFKHLVLNTGSEPGLQ